MKHVVALSGGKDSTAMALALVEREPRDYQFVITPTGNELPEMIAHWALLMRLLGAPLTPITRHSLQGLIRRQAALPNHAQRWCTRMIKLEPYYEWLGTLGPVTSYVGLRADEETRPGMVFPNQGEIIMDFPMQRWGWTIDDVRFFLMDKGIEVPDRTDCAACFWQKLGEWYLLWRDNEAFYLEAEMLEDYVTAVRGKPYTFRSPQRDSWPASLKDLRLEFEAGRVPSVSLNRMEKDKLRTGFCRVCTL